jgi:hypothetical protein
MGQHFIQIPIFCSFQGASDLADLATAEDTHVYFYWLQKNSFGGNSPLEDIEIQEPINLLRLSCLKGFRLGWLCT